MVTRATPSVTSDALIRAVMHLRCTDPFSGTRARPLQPTAAATSSPHHTSPCPPSQTIPHCAVQSALLSKIMNEEWTWPDSACDLSYDCKDFISQLLAMEPAQRMTAAQALQHNWIKSVERRGSNASTYTMRRDSSDETWRAPSDEPRRDCTDMRRSSTRDARRRESSSSLSNSFETHPADRRRSTSRARWVPSSCKTQRGSDSALSCLRPACVVLHCSSVHGTLFLRHLYVHCPPPPSSLSLNCFLHSAVFFHLTVFVPHARWEAYRHGSLPLHNLVSDSANPHYVSDRYHSHLWDHHRSEPWFREVVSSTIWLAGYASSSWSAPPPKKKSAVALQQRFGGGSSCGFEVGEPATPQS